MTFSRRAFLFGSAAVAGGVAFGPAVFAQDMAPPLPQGAAPPAATINPWVVIGPERITVVTPHADVGQGVASVQAALIAEELDIDLDQPDVSFGPPDPAYANTGLAGEFVPFEAYDLSPEAEAARKQAADWIASQGMQMTGGSSTVPDSYDKLRLAGAVARETVKAAAAKRSGMAVADLTTEAGQVVLPDGTRIPYTELAAEAAAIPPVENVALRDPSEWRILGKPMQRVDVEAKATGAMKFGLDLTLDGMVYAALRVNPYKGAGLNGYDAAEALAMPGVSSVVEVTNGIAVIASNSWYAMRAAEAVKCDWAQGDYPPDQSEHWAVMEASFADEHREKIWRDEGDVDTALAGDGVIEAEYRAPYLAHQPLEPLSALVLVTDEGAEIWVGHQIPNAVQGMVAQITGHPVEKVVFHNLYSGGSFGHRLEFENIRPAAEVANKMRGTPVKLIFSREEDFLQDFPRQLSMARLRGVAREGTIEAAEFLISSTPVMASQMGRLGMPVEGPDAQTPMGVRPMSYGIPNLRVSTYAATGLSPVSSWRSVGASTGGFFSESFIDELIHAAGLDPLQARIDMCKIDYHRKVIEAAGEMCGWQGPLGDGKGRGVAFVESFGVPVCEVVEVTATENGIRLDNVWVAADVGPVLDPVNFQNLVQGGVVWALGHAMNCELTYAGGQVQQTNYQAHEGMRIHQCPAIEVRGLANGPKIRGIGEPPVPPAAPALANAIFAATGQRIREMPFNRFIDFV
ncbi:molybdopterin cofactor-binding domain-containing protein [Paracoccus aurantiacus]|nr:molybdopterin cofactor-binding domain-containing protein [Paracoccus aurantiacus]